MPDFAKRASHKDAILTLLSDGRWHKMSELLEVGGYRYSARIHELRKKGYAVEKQTLGGDVFWYRMVPKGGLFE